MILMVRELIKRRSFFIAAIVPLSLLIGLLSGPFPESLFVAFCLGLILCFAVLRLYTYFLFTVLVYPILPQYIGFDLFGLVLMNPQRMLLAILVTAWFCNKIYEGDRFFTKTPLNLAIVLFLALRLFSIPFSLDVKVSIFRYFSELLTCFLSFYLIVDLVRSKEKMRRVIDILLLSGFVICMLGIYEFTSGTNIFASFSAVREGYRLIAAVQQFRLGMLRVEAGFGHSLLMGMYMCLLLPLSLGRSKSAEGWNKIKYIALSTLICSIVIITFSRSAWFAMFFVLIVHFIVIVRKFLPVVLLVLSFVALVVLNPFQLITPMLDLSTKLEQPPVQKSSSMQGRPQIPERSAAVKGEREIASSTSARMKQVKIVLPKVLKKPLTGYGIGKSREAVNSRPLDNYYLSLLLESGIPSLFLFLVIPILVIVKLLRIYRYSRCQTTGALAASLSLSVMSFILLLAALSLAHLFFSWWVIIALSVRLILSESDDHTIPKNSGTVS